jgi:hypothetical protein
VNISMTPKDACETSPNIIVPWEKLRVKALLNKIAKITKSMPQHGSHHDSDSMHVVRQNNNNTMLSMLIGYA